MRRRLFAVRPPSIVASVGHGLKVFTHTKKYFSWFSFAREFDIPPPIRSSFFYLLDHWSKQLAVSLNAPCRASVCCLVKRRARRQHFVWHVGPSPFAFCRNLHRPHLHSPLFPRVEFCLFFPHEGSVAFPPFLYAGALFSSASLKGAWPLSF